MLDQYITQGAVDSKSIIPVATCVAGTQLLDEALRPEDDPRGDLGGKLQGLPYSVSAPILIYNQNAFAKAKIKSAPTDDRARWRSDAREPLKKAQVRRRHDARDRPVVPPGLGGRATTRTS